MKIFPHIRLHFLWFCQKQNNFFVACKRLQFFGVVKTTKLIFFACISVQFEFCFCEIYNNRVFSMYYTSYFMVLCKTIQKSVISMYLILILWFWENNKRLFFLCIRIKYFFWKSKTTELFSRIRHQFLWSSEKQYYFCFFYVKDFNFCDFVKKQNCPFFHVLYFNLIFVIL